MKKIFIISILFILFIDKSIALLSDFRDSNLGYYSCNRFCQILNVDHTGLTMINDTITIQITKDVIDSVLDLSINQIIFKVKLVNDTMYSFLPGRYFGGVFFSTDSLSFSSSETHTPDVCGYRGGRN